MTASSAPRDIAIPGDKLLSYLLLPREENDKSKYLNSAGYNLTSWEVLARDLRQLIQANELLYSALSEIASSVGAISRSRRLYEGTPIPDLLVLRKSY